MCAHVEIAGVINLVCPDEVLLERALGRGTGRQDDKEEVIRQRIQLHKDETEPIIKQFGAKGLVYDIDSTRDLPTNVKEILSIFEGTYVKPAEEAKEEEEYDESYDEEIGDEAEGVPPAPGEQKAFFILGGPASGKGTYCTKLNKEHGIPHFSTGDLLRAEIASGSELAAEIQGLMKEGKLIGSDIVVSLLLKAFKTAKSHTYLIDGFPRN
jgi:adenylate kinase family enzyme